MKQGMQHGTFTKYSIPPCAWGVYERADGAGYVVLALPLTRPHADILPLPVDKAVPWSSGALSVHPTRRAADLAACKLLYDCVGSA